MEDKEVLDQIGRVYMWASTMFVFLMVAGVVTVALLKIN